MAWATTTAKQLRPVQWSPWQRQPDRGQHGRPCRSSPALSRVVAVVSISRSPRAQGATARSEADGWLHRPASQPTTLHADLVVAPSSATTVPAALRLHLHAQDDVYFKEGSPVGRLALAWTSTVHQRSYVQGELQLT